MTEQEWLRCMTPTPMLWEFLDRFSKRKLRLYACARCREIGRHLRDERSRFALETAERYADGLARRDELNAAFAEAAAVLRSMGRRPCGRRQKGQLASDLVRAAREAAEAAQTAADPDLRLSRALRGLEDHNAARAYILAEILRDLFGPLLFRTVAVQPGWLTADVVGLSTTIYEEYAFERLPILADALMDAGCTDEDILAHCRSAGPHARGCWVVDLIRGKQ